MSESHDIEQIAQEALFAPGHVFAGVKPTDNFIITYGTLFKALASAREEGAREALERAANHIREVGGALWDRHEANDARDDHLNAMCDATQGFALDKMAETIRALPTIKEG